MKFNKIIATALTAILAIGTLSGCGGSSSPSTSSTPTGESSDKLKVVTLLNGTRGDRSFFDSANDGTVQAAEVYGIETKVIEMTYDQTKWEPTLADVCEEDWDIIIAGTWQLADLVKTYSEQYPEKKFILYDTDFDFESTGAENVYAMVYKQNEGSYLAGILGAKMTSSGLGTYNDAKTIGFIGGNDTPIINDFLVGYIQGATETDPDVKINVSYVYDFSNTGKAKELAMTQYSRDTDIIFSVAATAGLGILDAAKEKGLYAIGVDADQGELFKDSDPEKANLIPTSMLKRVDNSIVRAIGLELEGNLPWGETEFLGIKEGCIGLAKNEIYEESVPEDVKLLIDDAQEKILNGEIIVDTALGASAEEIKAAIDSVKPAL